MGHLFSVNCLQGSMLSISWDDFQEVQMVKGIGLAPGNLKKKQNIVCSLPIPIQSVMSIQKNDCLLTRVNQEI